MQKLALFTFLFLMGSLLGCSSVKTVSEASFENNDEQPVAYSGIFFIHGDADYLYHDRDGRPAEADEQALAKAKRTAEEAITGEIFIFHQKKRKKILGLFPRRTNQLYHYKNGRLASQTAYRNKSTSESFFETESELFHNIRANNAPDNFRSFFFYFGHEIPLLSGESYHNSRAEISVHTESFTSGLKTFIGEHDMFDLVVLSTCSNGTPKMANQLQGITDVLLASPQNLHLSHINPIPLIQVEQKPEITSFRLAEAIAKESFRRLTETVQTAVTLTVYDMEKISAYTDELNRQTDGYIEQEVPNMYRDNTDCATLPFFDSERYKNGVTTFFRPSVFGSDKGSSEHSGWGCKGI